MDHFLAQKALGSMQIHLHVRKFAFFLKIELNERTKRCDGLEHKKNRNSTKEFTIVPEAIVRGSLWRYAASKPSASLGTRSPDVEAPPVLSSLNPFRREFGAGRTPAPKRRSPVLENRAESFPVSPDELGHELC